MRIVRWLAVVSLMAAVLGVGSTAGAAAIRPAAIKPPATPTTLRFEIPTLAITTSTHKALLMNVLGVRVPAEKHGSELVVALRLPHRFELHQWFFPLKPASLAISAATGRGKLNTGASQIAPFGLVSLRFTPVGKTTTHACSTTKTVVHRVNVTGKIRFNSHSAGPQSWGSFGSVHKNVKFVGHGVVTVQYGELVCQPHPGREACRTEVNWQVTQGAVIMGGSWFRRHGKLRTDISGTRSVPLTTPKGSGRIDSVLQLAQPPPALTVADKKPTLVVTTTGHDVTGSAELTSDTPEPQQSAACGGGHDMVGTDWSDAAFINGDQPLIIHEQIEGQIRIADKTDDQSIETTRQVD